MKSIAFDVMSNDDGIGPAVEAAIAFSKENINYKIILIGNRKEISKYTRETEKLEIQNVTDYVKNDDSIIMIRKKKSSMLVAINLVKSGRVDAVLSSGPSAAFITLTTLILKKLPNISRAAFMPIFPTIELNKKFVMLDVGANLETTSTNLIQWSEMGNIFAKEVLNVEKPRIGILNIGTESHKGFSWHHEADKSLKSNKKINYVGFVEPRELLSDIVDVAISDGYGGNLILKSMEGAILAMSKMLKKSFKKNLKRIIGGLLSKSAFREVKENFDYRNVGGAWIIGVNGLAIKAHGSSNKKAFIGALNQVKIAIDNQIIDKFKKAM